MVGKPSGAGRGIPASPASHGSHGDLPSACFSLDFEFDVNISEVSGRGVPEGGGGQLSRVRDGAVAFCLVKG